MKPRTKLQKRVFQLFEDNHGISEEQKKYAFLHCFEHYAFKTKHGDAECLECNHTFKADIGLTKCPNCGIKLKVEQTRKRTHNDKKIFNIITCIDEFQVIKSYEVGASYKKGRKPHYYTMCCYYHFLRDDGKVTSVSRLSYQYWGCGYGWTNNLEIRNRTVTNFPDKIYPKMKIRPLYKRNGFKTSFFDWEPLYLLQHLVSDRRYETLWKLGHRNWLTYYYNSFYPDETWILIRLCIRNNFFPDRNDILLWKDYVDTLKYFNLNIHDVKLLCPKDIHAAHNEYMEKKKIEVTRLNLIREQKIIKDSAIRKERDRKAAAIRDKFTFSIDVENISIKLLKTEEEYKYEGEVLKHCVADYFNKPNSLIFSAKKGKTHLETIEVLIDNMEVNQCRGYSNCNSKKHEAILNIMNEHLPVLRKQKYKFLKQLTVCETQVKF